MLHDVCENELHWATVVKGAASQSLITTVFVPIPAAWSRSASSFRPMSASASPSGHGSREAQALPDVLDGLQLVKPRPSPVPTLGPLQHARRLRFITEICGSNTVSCQQQPCMPWLSPLRPIGRKRSSVMPKYQSTKGTFPSLHIAYCFIITRVWRVEKPPYAIVWPTRPCHQQCLAAASAPAT